MVLGVTSLLTPRLDAILAAQRSAFLKDPSPSVAVRTHRMDRLMSAVLDNADELCDAINSDFGQRCAAATLATDILAPLPDILHIRRNVAAWSRPRRIGRGMHSLLGMRVRIVPQPLGVVGVIAPWNFPITLALQPTFAALAAGNRVMIKMSEVTPRAADVLARVVGQTFAVDELAVVVGDASVASAFAGLAFDHLFFTGSPAVGQLVQRAAADHLVPVTLELGGKNPAVVARDADMARAAKRITAARMVNGGQLCLCPDYVLVPREKLEGFLAHAESAWRRCWPTVADNPSYPWIVDERNYIRLQDLVGDAESKGAKIKTVRPEGDKPSSPQHRWMAPTLVWDLDAGMRLYHEEVFGPILSVFPYDTVDDIVAQIAERPAALAAYWYGPPSPEFDEFSRHVRCGGLSRNDFAIHALPNGAPFGGVGNSGFGYYHGRAGFDAFSHLRTTASTRGRFSMMSFASPPFTPLAERAMRMALRLLRGMTRRRASAEPPELR